MSQEVTEKIIDSDVDLVSEQTNAIVRYNNGLNTTALRGFKPVEMDVFWAILSKMKRQGTAEVTFDFNLFRYLVKYDRREKDSFYSVLKALSDKLGTLTYRFEDSDVYEQLWLFQKFRIDKQKETVTIKANEEFEFILNSIGKNFTRFELDNFTKLRSSYTKELYRHLMQYRNKEWRNGYWVVKVEDFRRALSIPSSYRMTNIDKRILEQAKEEFLAPDENGIQVFETFDYEKIYAKKGRRVDRLRFTFSEQESNLPTISMHNWLEED